MAQSTKDNSLKRKVTIFYVSAVILLMIIGMASPTMAWVSPNPNPSQIGNVLTEGAGYFSKNVTSPHFFFPNGTELLAYPVKPMDYICWVQGSTYYSQSGLNGKMLYKGADATAMLQNTLNAMTGGGSIYLKSGIYILNGQLTIPYGLSYYIYGDGIPSFPYPVGYTASFTTPSDGTQLRFSSSFLSTGTATNLITRASGATSKGVLSLSGLAIMPPWGTPTSGTVINGVYDRYSAILIEDNIMFVPWGWTEASQPTPAANFMNSQYMAPTKSSGTLSAGGGSEARVGYLVEYGMSNGSVFNGFDDVKINRVVLWRCRLGIVLDAIWDNNVEELSSYDTQYYPIDFSGGVRGNRLGILNLENPSITPQINYAVHLGTFNYVTINYVFNWVTTGDAKYTQITNIVNDAQLEGTTIAYNMGLSGLLQSFPLSVVFSTPFGDTIANPFNSASPYSIGTGGSTPTPTSGRTYTVNVPIDFSITSGTLTVRDAQGATISGGLSHRLLLPGYTISVTSPGTVTVIQATVGLGGTTAAPKSGVNYVANGCSIYVSSSDGSGVSITTYDGSNNLGGNVMDSSLATMTRYRLDMGQVINFGSFSSAPTTTIVRAK